MIDYDETKEHPITKKMVLEAFKVVKSNKGAPGWDKQSIADYEESLLSNTYKVWNRMSSGSYHPEPVREVEIPKDSGRGKRKLGIPTVMDRVAQQVVKAYLEPKVDPTFHPDSFGYRPNRDAHMAISRAMTRCGQIGWVLDMDIKSFFDNIDHELMLKALKHYCEEKWVLMYISRWLKADLIKQNGEREARLKGTPQGGVISGLLANIFLHFTFDKWMEKYYPNIRFERYSDEIIIHCVSEKQVRFIQEKVKARFSKCKLEISEEKTKIVYCPNYRNREQVKAESSFTFLGYELKPRFCPTKYGLRLLTSASMSKKAKNRFRDKIRLLSIRKFKGNIQQLSRIINIRVRGVMNYYCKFHKWTTQDLWRWLNKKLIGWVRSNKRLGKRKAIKWLGNVYRTHSTLFNHWALVPPIRTGKRRKSYNCGRAV